MSTANCTADFWENSANDNGSHDGGHRKFTGPVSYSNLSQLHYDNESGLTGEMDDSINSLATGSQAWLIVYSDNDYSGRSEMFGPNRTVGDLGDWKNDIASFQLFDFEPVDVNLVQSNFEALYPGSVKTNTSEGMSLNYYQQDASYTVYYPTISQDPLTTPNIGFTMNLEHHNALGERDRAQVTFTMDPYGHFVDKIAVTYDMGSGAYQVPNWAIKIIDFGIDEAEEAAIEFFDGAEIVLTAGVGAELVIPTDILIMGAADVLTAVVDHLNNIISKLFGLSDDGGTMYFGSSVTHAIVRLLYAYNQERYGANSGDLVYFDQSAFQSAMHSSWATTDEKNNPYLLFSQSGSNYRSYFPDNSAGYAKSGLVSSVKIDAINDGMDKDDHLILTATFDPKGNLFSVQGSIDICGAPDDGDTDDYVAPASGTFAYNKNGQVIQVTKDSATVLTGYSNVTDAYRHYMQEALDNVGHVTHSNFSASLKGLVDASVTVVGAIDAAVKS